MQVYTASGQTLVDNSAHLLSFTAASSVTANASYSAGSSSGLSGISVNGVDVTTQITSGEIGSLLSLRDSVTPQRGRSSTGIANTLADTLNAQRNQARRCRRQRR